MYVVCGGAGGTLDEDLVEDWGFYERSIKGQYHFGWLGLGFAGGDSKVGKVAVQGESARVYKVKGRGECRFDEDPVTDVLEWRAIGLDGRQLDAFRMEAQGCQTY